jgi:hypothetical protein
MSTATAPQQIKANGPVANGPSTNNPSAAAPASDPWRMEASSKGGGEPFVACPAGNYPATIVGIFDIGQQQEDYGGECKEVRQLVIVVELSKKQPDGKPFVLGNRYTWSMNKKANFRGVVEGITGHTFADGEPFDPRSVLGLPVMVNVTNQTKGEGEGAKTYHNIKSISQFPDGFPNPTPTKAQVAWSVAEGTPFPTEPEPWLPFIYGSSIKDLVETSREWRRRGGGANANATTAPADDDDSPF